MMTHVLRRSVLSTSGLALVFLAGCDKPDGTNAGFTNGPAPVASDKAAVRSDLPAEAAPSAGGMAGSIDNTPAGPAANKTDDSVKANPPAKELGSDASAAGATKPAGTIKTGTPKSPE